MKPVSLYAEEEKLWFVEHVEVCTIIHIHITKTVLIFCYFAISFYYNFSLVNFQQQIRTLSTATATNDHIAGISITNSFKALNFHFTLQ